MTTGLLCQSRNHRPDVPSVRFGGRDDAHLDLQNVDLRPGKELRGRSAAAPGAPRRWRGQLAVGRCEEETWRPKAAVPVQGVLLLAALLPRRRPDDEDREHLLFVDGTPRFTGPNPVSHPPHEPPFDLQRKGSGGGGRTRGGRGGPVHVELSGGDAGGTARDIPNPSCARAQRRQVSVRAHRTTGAQTTEPKHHNSESVNDVRVSSKRTNCRVRHDDPGLEPADLLRGHAEQHEVGVVTIKTAVTVHHVGDRRTSFSLGPFRV